VWKYINKIKEDGYEIEACPNRGYRLRRHPDKLFSHEVLEGFAGELFSGDKYYHYEQLPSTNNTAYSLAEEGAPEGAVVVAEEQTSGKGRMGRRWESPRGGIYFSIILRPSGDIERIPSFALTAGYSVVKSLEKAFSLDARLKWPNDVLVKGRKICGVLSEMKAQPGMVDFLVAGIGLNANTAAESLPEEATSVKQETGNDISRCFLMRTVLECLEDSYSRFAKNGFRCLRDEIVKSCSFMGERVCVDRGGVKTEGVAADIDEHGALILELPGGSRERILSGDVKSCRGVSS
ncbi:MAG: biotin--[acetyl-CoA-carboxylase] ligase, partial [Candidatus Omnitrophica bacterium]|nr:biotin--[acetyl-CoA-carboxylase] ligase [Candidatus Omnitrophota bacterium]